MSHVIPRSAQKSNIFCVSAMPPINDPAKFRRERRNKICRRETACR
jgi:hypothetical protein